MITTAKYTEGSIKKYLGQLSLPAIVTIFMGLSFVAVDTVFLAHYSQNALVAISFCFPVIALFQMVGNGLGIAASSLLSRYMGAGDIKKTDNTLMALLMISVVLSILIIPIGELLIRPLFTMMGANEAVMPLIQSFMRIWFLGFFFLLINFIGANVLRSAGKPIVAANTQIISSVLNIILSPLLIFTAHLGVTGSALAGVIARIATGALLYRLVLKYFLHAFKDTLIETLKQMKHYTSSILVMAIPAIMTNAIGPLSSIILVHMLSRYGDTTVAGFGIASRIEMLAVVPLLALSASVGPVIGQNFGAQHFGRSFETLKTSYTWSLLWGGLIAITLFFLGHAMALCFTHDTAIIHIATLYFFIMPCSYASWGLIMMTNANFNSTGKPLRSTAITLLRLLILCIPLCYLFGYYFGYLGIFTAFALSNILTSLGSVYWGLSSWKRYAQ